MTNQNRPDAKKNATQAQQQAYEELLRSRIQLPELEGFPKFRDFFTGIMGDIVSEHAIYEGIRQSYYLDQNIQYVSNKDVENSYNSMKRILDAEVETYSSIPRQELFNHFKTMTLNKFKKKKELTPEEEKVKKILEDTKLPVTSFYEFSQRIGVLPYTQRGEALGDSILRDNIQKLDKIRADVALSIYYYMEMLGVEDLPSLPLFGYDVFSDIGKQITQPIDGKEILRNLNTTKDNLTGMTLGYDYMLHCISKSLKFNNACEFASKMEPEGSPARDSWRKLKIPTTYAFPLELKEILSQIPVVAAPDIKYRDDFVKQFVLQGDNAIKKKQAFELVNKTLRSYALNYQNWHHKNNNPNIEGRSSLPVPPIPVYSSVRAVGMHDWKEKSGQIKTLFDIGLDAGLDLQSELEMGFTGVKILTSLATPGVAIKGWKGIAVGAGITVGSFIYDPIDEILDFCLRPILNCVKKGDTQEAVAYCYDVNRNIDKDIKDLNRELFLIQNNPHYKEALKHFVDHREGDELHPIVQKEFNNPFGNNFFDRDKIEREYESKIQSLTDSGVDLTHLRDSYRKMLHLMLDLEEKRMQVNLYTYCMNLYENSESSKRSSDEFDAIVKFASSDNDGSEKKHPVIPRNLQPKEPLTVDAVQSFVEERVVHLLANHEMHLKEFHRVVQKGIDIRESKQVPFERTKIIHETKAMQELMAKLNILSDDTDIEQAQSLLNRYSTIEVLSEKGRIGNGTGDGIVGFSVEFNINENIMLNEMRSSLHEMIKVHYSFLKGFQSYMQDNKILECSEIYSLFKNRQERINNARAFGMPDEYILAEFESELAVLSDMEDVLKTAPDFAIVCQKNGWIDKDGKPNLNKIAPIPNDGKSVEKAMARADAMEKRVLALLKGFESYRYDIIKNNQTEISQSQEQMQSTQSENRSDEVEGDDGVTVTSKPPFVELSSETKGKIDDYLSKYHNNDVNSPYLGEYAIVKFANNSRNDPEYLATIQYLIAKGADINATDKYTGRSVLGFMYRHLSPEQLDYFFNENANIDLSVREKDGSTVFYTAFDSHFKSDDKLNVLFESVEDNPEQLSLMLEGALRHGDLEWANNLIEAGADLKNSMPQLLVSAASCSLDIKPLTFLLEHGATIEDFNKALNILNTYDLSPRDKEDAMEHLISVASIEIPETMRISNAIEDKKHYYENLPTDPAVINQKDKYGNTLLMQAVQRADIRAIQHYLTHGADVTLTNNAGKTALAIAKDGLNEETPSSNRDYSYCAKLLIGDGAADKETEESRNLNALIEAVYSGDTAGVKKISAQMPRLNIQTPEGEDVYSAWAKRIIVLINNAENPADIEKISHMDIEDMTQVKGLNKERALLILSHGLTLFPEENERDTKARELLSQLAIKLVDKMHSIDINCVDEWGNTPLHYACATGDKKLAETLLNKHAFVNVKNALGQTPHDVGVMARKMGNWISEEAIKKANDMKYPYNGTILPLDRLFYNRKINLSGHVWKYERSDEYDYLLLHLERERHFSQLKQVRRANSHVVERVTSVPDELIAFEQQRVQQATAALIAELSVTDRAPNKERIEAFLKAGADANATGELNLSLLRLAIVHGCVGAEGVAIVKLLIDHGATVNEDILTTIDKLKNGEYKDDSDAQARLDQIKTMIEGALGEKTPHPQPNVSSKIGANAQPVGEGMPRPPAEKER